MRHIGAEDLPYWDEDIKKGLSIKNKFKIICHSVNFAPHYTGRPFQSFKDIIKYRNLMAHAYPRKSRAERYKYYMRASERNTLKRGGKNTLMLTLQNGG